MNPDQAQPETKPAKPAKPDTSPSPKTPCAGVTEDRLRQLLQEVLAESQQKQTNAAAQQMREHVAEAFSALVPPTLGRYHPKNPDAMNALWIDTADVALVYAVAVVGPNGTIAEIRNQTGLPEIFSDAMMTSALRTFEEALEMHIFRPLSAKFSRYLQDLATAREAEASRLEDAEPEVYRSAPSGLTSQLPAPSDTAMNDLPTDVFNDPPDSGA